MKEFSIELAAENIVDNRTREYFAEVLSSFINGNYRSAIVMLWSVVISDMVYKLQTLRDLYQDQTATSILEAIENKQQANPSSPEWEQYLIGEIFSRTQLLEAADYQHIINLQKLRHLSAHPVLSDVNLLFSPNKETTRALIRNALEAVLLKPPIFTKKIIKEFVVDISDKKDLLPDQHALKRYLESKYFKNLHPTVEKELIKTIWKFCFRLSNQDVDINREINKRVMDLLYLRNPVEFRGFVADNSEYFSEITPSGDPACALIYFLSEHPEIYSVLNDSAKAPLSTYVESDVNLFSRAIFLSRDLGEHISKLQQFKYAELRELEDSNWSFLVSHAREAGLLQELFEIGIFIYCNSGNFDSADSNFARFIEPYIHEFDNDRLAILLEGIEDNNQTYWRGRAQIDHRKVLERINVLGGIDLEKYPHFGHSLPEAD